MVMTQTHIIRRQILHVDMYGTETDGLSLQHTLPLICQTSLSTVLEGVLDQLAAPADHVLIERLEIDAGTISLGDLEHELAASVSAALQTALRETMSGDDRFNPARGVRYSTAKQAVQEAFLYFLESGILPWWYRLPAGQTLEQAVLAGLHDAGGQGSIPGAFVSVLSEALGSKDVRKRLTQQFSLPFVATMLAAMGPQDSDGWYRLLPTDGSSVPTQAIVRFLQNVCDAALTRVAAGVRLETDAIVLEGWLALPPMERQSPEILAYLQQRVPDLSARFDSHAWADRSAGVDKGGNVFTDGDAGKSRPMGMRHPFPGKDETVQTRAVYPGDAGQAAAQSSNDIPSLQDGVFVPNAGVIIVHPFLPRLFETLNIADGARIVDPERGLQVLYYLATGQRCAPEYDLLLPKLLCGVPWQRPVATLGELGNDAVLEGNALLDAVIRNWEDLRDTSHDGLRGTFLSRPGKLSEREDGDFLLQVEPQAFDILLQALPWGIGVVKLPWMPKLLWVEWN